MNEPRKRYRPKIDKRDTATRLADYVSSLKLNNPKLTPREIANPLEISPFHPPTLVGECGDEIIGRCGQQNARSDAVK